MNIKLNKKIALTLVLLSPPSIQMAHSADDNTNVGTGAGENITTGENNTNVGKNAGNANTTKSDTVMIGYNAGALNNAIDNTFVGSQSGQVNTTGDDNTFVGKKSGQSNTTGADNTFVGEESGQSNTTGKDNTFMGEDAGYSNTDGDGNVGIGRGALYQNTVGFYNTAVGNQAGYKMGYQFSFSTAFGMRNTAVGNHAGYDIADGVANTMLGDNAGTNTGFGDFNTFVGFVAGYDNNRTNNLDEGNRNTSLGAYAGYTNRTGDDNVWIGALADSAEWSFTNNSEVANLQPGANWQPEPLLEPTNQKISVSRTTVLGNNASVLKNDAIGVGYSSKADGVGSIAIGTNSTASHTNSITIGYGATSKAINTVVIGNDTTTALTANIDATTSLGNSTYRFTDVYTNKMSVNAATATSAQIDLFADAGNADDDKWSVSAANGGNLTLSTQASGSMAAVLTLENDGDVIIAGDLTLNSDERLKYNIQPIENSLQLLSQLQGKSYFWDPELQRDNKQHLGLIAQQVEAVLPELVNEAKSGIKSVNYLGMIPVLINGVNELTQQVELQQQQAELQQQQIALLQQQITLLKEQNNQQQRLLLQKGE